MAEDAKAHQREYERREREAADFWTDYVYLAWEGKEKRRDVPEVMHDALAEIFGKMKAAIAKATETGCTFFRYRSVYERPEVTTLIFSDGRGKQFQRTLRIDGRFTIHSQALHFHDYWWLRIALTSIIAGEEKVKLDPRGGWIPDEILDNAHKLRSEIVTDKKTGEVRLNVTVDQEQT